MFANRVQFNCTSPGTGAFEVGSAVTGYKVPADIPGLLGRQMGYLAFASTSEWELGIGTLTDGSPDTLARTIIRMSTNSNNAVNFTGSLVVACIDLAEFHGAHAGEFHFGTTGGSAAALTASFFPVCFALRDGMMAAVRLHTNIGATATFSPNSLTAKPIKQQSPSGLIDVAAGDWKSGMILWLRYDGSAEVWQILNGMVQTPVSSASETAEGIVERATMTEALAGSDTSRYVTPAHLAAATGKKGSNLPDGGTVTIPLTGGTYFVLDGTTSLTTVALEGGNSARQPGFKVLLGFAAAKTIVHSSSLDLVDNVNLAVVAGDLLELVYLGSGNWKESDFHLETSPSPPPDPPDAVDIEVDAATSGVTLNGSMADTGLEVTVVVSDATSKVVLIATVAWEGNNDEMRFQWRRDSTDIGPDIGQAIYDNGVSNHRGVVTLMRYDAPGAGTFVYKLRARKTGSGSAVLVTQTGPSNDEAQVVGIAVVPVA